MLKLGILFLVAALLTAGHAFGADSVETGFQAFYNLDYSAALMSFDAAAAADPGNPDLHNHIAQTLLYRELWRNGSLESQLVSGNNSFLRRAKLNPSPEIEKRFFAEIDKALALSGARISKNPQDAPAIHMAGASHALRANFNFLVRKAWNEALADATEARKLDMKATEIDPTLIDAKMVQGVHDYVVGSLSWTYKTLGFLAGFRGDKQRGIKLVEEVYKNGKASRIDAQIMLCVLYRREKQTKRAIPLLEDLIRQFPQNYLFRFEAAQLFSVLGERAKCLAALDEVAALKQAGAPGYERVPWDKIWFQKGNLLFWFNDLDESMANLRKVTSNPKELDLNTGVLAYMRQGQILDLKNQHDQAVKLYEMAMNFAPEADAARESRHYVSNPYDRNSKWRP